MSERKLDDWLEGYLRYTDNSEPPKSYKLWTGISMIAACLQRKCYLSWGELTFYPNMYIVLVGPSGRCRKGTAMSVGSKFLREIGIKTTAESVTREALIRELKESEVQDTHPESQKIYFHSSLTIYSQELTVFLGYNNLALMSDITDWYDCRDTWTYRTKNMGTDEVLGVYVNLIGATTPDLIRTALPQDLVGGGLASRIIFVFEENKGKLVPAPFLTKEDQLLRQHLLQDLDRIFALRGEFAVTEGFIEGWIKWYTESEHKSPFRNDERFDGYVSRRPNHIMKLCMILSASRDDKMIIDISILNRAVGILEKIERKMPYAFTGYGSAENADITSRMMAIISKAGSEGIDKRVLMRNQYHNLKSTEQFIEILVKLTQIGFCIVDGDKVIYDKGFDKQ